MKQGRRVCPKTLISGRSMSGIPAAAGGEARVRAMVRGGTQTEGKCVEEK